jgi:hypothetical protein
MIHASRPAKRRDSTRCPQRAVTACDRHYLVTPDLPSEPAVPQGHAGNTVTSSDSMKKFGRYWKPSMRRTQASKACKYRQHNMQSMYVIKVTVL